MQEIHKEWSSDHSRWMNDETIRNYEWWRSGKYPGDQQKAHQIRRQAFSAFLFQVIGNKHVLLASIQHPICSAEQPAAAIQRFMTAWEQEKTSDDYKKRVQISEALTEKRRALKKAAHKARQDLVLAVKLNGAITRGSRAWDDLTGKEQALVEDLNSGKLTQARDDCDAAFGWNAQARSAAGSAANRLGR
jgi:hypothetical protein